MNRLAVSVLACAGVLALLAAWRNGPGPAPAAAPAPAAPPPAAPAPRWLEMRPASMPAGPQAFMAPPAAAPFYGRSGRPVDFGGKEAAGYIAARAAAARRGDARAAYDAYAAASACATLDDPLPEFLDAREGAAAARERTRLRGLCAGVTPAQVQERMRFLAQAADAGNRDAMVDFYMEGPGGRAPSMADAAADPAVQAWRAQALGYLRQAGGTCDHFALGLLSTAYDTGQLAPRDMGTSMAYAIAAAHARHVPLTEDQLRARFGDDLAPDAFAAALRTGAALAQSACPQQGSAPQGSAPQGSTP